MLALLGCKIQKQPMRKVYTTDDLIRFIYRETSENEERGIMEQLTSDESFLQEYRTIVKTVTALDEKPMEPHPTSLSIIMEYSASLNEKTVH